MSGALTVVGVSHRGAPLSIRERLHFRPSELGPLLEQVRDRAGAVEGVALSTCNRTEIYFVGGGADDATVVWQLLSDRLGEDASAYGYLHRDREASAHLFRVASGLDSMILGEAQIHGQVRTAWEDSREHSGVVLNRLFQTSLLVAGRVRSETSVGRGAASVSSAAVQLSKQIFGSLGGRRAMVLGAGDMAELALECLADEGVRTAVVANRTRDRAEHLAERYGATALTLEECWAALAEVDLLICSTASPRPIVLSSHVRPALSTRRDRPLCVLDIALPRDVDPEVRELDNVFLYDLDDLQAVVSSSLERRRGELPNAERLIGEETERFWEWFASLAVVPVLTRFRSEMELVRARETEQALRRMSTLTPEQQAAVEQLTRSLMNKFLHEPTVRMRAAASNGRGLGIIDAVRYLFGLDEPKDAADKSGGARGSHHTTTGEH